MLLQADMWYEKAEEWVQKIVDFNLGRSSQKLTPLTLHATAHVIIWVSFVIVSVNTVNIASASKATYLYLCK